MDTPVKNHSTPFSSQFEDSPVFNYISNLSPIETVKSGLNNHTLNSLNFASPPSVFTSPQISSFSETRFSLKRHSLIDHLKPESTEGENGVSIASQLDKPTYFDSRKSTEEEANKPPIESLELAVELPSTLKYDSGSPDVARNNATLASVDKGASLKSDVDDFEDGHSLNRENDMRRICRVEKNKEPEGPSWVKLVSDSDNVLRIDSPIALECSEEEESGMVDSRTMSVIANFLDDSHSTVGKEESFRPTGSCELFYAQPEPIVDVKEMGQTPAVLSSNLSDKLVLGDSCDLVDDGNHINSNTTCKPRSQLHRGMRRRSLVFERAETHKRKSVSSVTHLSDDNISSDANDLIQTKNGSVNLLPKFPGIGLHLNAITNNKDGTVANEAGDFNNQLIDSPRIIKPCSSIAPYEIPPDNSLSRPSLDGALVLWKGESQVNESTYRTSESLAGKEFEHSSPKNKRRKSETVGESLACKRCNCKRSKCLKLYCECFAAGLYCVEPCSCQDCLNKPMHESVVLETRKQIESRNPLAFAPKVIRNADADAVSEFGEEKNATPSSARHKRGCNCRKSGCLKKYCECYQGGVGCSMSCRCMSCKNTFGQKDGSEESCFRESKMEYENPGIVIKDQDFPQTPSEIGRPSNQSRPNLSKNPKIPSFIPPLRTLHTSNTENPEKVNYGHESSQLQMIPEEGTLETVETGTVKSTSPNSKRVSPPYREFGSLTARRSGRKLILRSIPAFPQLADFNERTNDLP